MSNLNHFAFAADEQYSLQMKIAVASLLHACRRHPREFHVHILDVGLKETTLDRMCALWRQMLPSVIIERHKIDAKRYSHYRLWNNSLATYARLDLPRLLPTVEWCFYVDCDTLQLSDPIALEALLMDGFLMVGHLNPRQITRDNDARWLKDIGVEVDCERYVCAGVLLMNLRGMRENDVGGKTFDFLTKFPKAIAPDQIALNVVCAGKVGLLPDSWGGFPVEIVRANTCDCIHFVGAVPWKVDHGWEFFLHKYRLTKLWCRFAEEFCDEPGLWNRYCGWRVAWKDRIKALVLKPILCFAALTRLYPRRFESVAQALRERMTSQAVADAERKLFSVTVELP